MPAISSITGPIIDCQSHLFPEAYADFLTQHSSTGLRAVGGDGLYTLDYFSPQGEHLQRFLLRLADYSVERKLAAMDEAGVAVSVLSINIPTPDLLGPEWAAEGAKIGNDALAELCRHSADRLVGLAALPLPDVEAAMRELDRCLDELDFRGVFLPSHLNGMALDDSSLEPFYAHVAQRGVPLVLHPSVPTWGAALREHSMIPMMGFMVDTSIAMLRLILAGVLERHPGLQVVHPHVGGVLPYLMGRIEEQTEVKRRGREQITRSPRTYYQQVYLDLVSPDPMALAYAMQVAGPERLLFGSDHPWVEIGTILAHVDACHWPQAVLKKVLHGNACRLFGIEL
jgi:predicted TIM-barrel fold metal-dependent hydrolase